MYRLILIAALAAIPAAATANANANGTETFGCATAKLQNGQGEGYNLNFVIFGPPPRMKVGSFETLAPSGPSAEVCGWIIAPGKGGFFNPPTRIIASGCQTVTPDDPFQLDVPFLSDVDEAFGRLRVTQAAMHQGGGDCFTAECAETLDAKNGGPPPRVRGTGALNVNTIFPATNAGTLASVPVECHPLPENDKDPK